jgi:hypothetical protein
LFFTPRKFYLSFTEGDHEYISQRLEQLKV